MKRQKDDLFRRPAAEGPVSPIPEDEDRRQFLATLKDASPAVLKAIAVFHRKRAMVAEERIGRTEAERDALKANLRQQIEGISRTRNDWINRAHELEAERDRALEALSAMIRIGEMYIEARAALASPNAKEEQSTE